MAPLITRGCCSWRRHFTLIIRARDFNVTYLGWQSLNRSNCMMRNNKIPGIYKQKFGMTHQISVKDILSRLRYILSIQIEWINGCFGYTPLCKTMSFVDFPKQISRANKFMTTMPSFCSPLSISWSAFDIFQWITFIAVLDTFVLNSKKNT